MKLLVQTTGAFSLIDPITGDDVMRRRPSVVRSSTFIGDRVARGQIKVFSNELSDDVTDQVFADWLKESDGNIDLAVASFVEAHLGTPKDSTVVEGKPRRKASK